MLQLKNHSKINSEKGSNNLMLTNNDSQIQSPNQIPDFKGLENFKKDEIDDDHTFLQE